MTTILGFKDGKHITIASDSQATSGNLANPVQKVHKINGYVFASAGPLIGLQKTARALVRDKKPASIERFIKHAEKGNVYVLAFKKHLYTVHTDGSVIEHGDREPVALGSGGDIALGALAAGASVQEAVEIATSFDVFSGGEVQVAVV